jgi:hypothetical protein
MGQLILRIVGSSFNDTTTDVLVAAENSLIILGYFTAYNGIAVSEISKYYQMEH